jgi:hypothetical protein
MEQVTGSILLLAVFVALLVTVCSQRWLIDGLREALNNFWGGPPSGMHPSPANDAFFLRRRSPKASIGR